MVTKLTYLLFLFSILLTHNAFSQFHFAIKYSAKDIYDQRELFKNASVELAIITDNSGFDEKITFDRKGKILEKINYQPGDEDAFDGKSIYEYDAEGRLISIKFESGDAMRPDEFIYDSNGNITRYISELCDEKYLFNESNELVSSEITKQTIEMSPIESVRYENGLITESRTKCWDEGVNAQYTFSKTKYTYDTKQRVTNILYIYGNCKTGIEEVSSETTIEYNEKNLPIEYITKDNQGNKSISVIRYKFYN